MRLTSQLASMNLEGLEQLEELRTLCPEAEEVMATQEEAITTRHPGPLKNMRIKNDIYYETVN